MAVSAFDTHKAVKDLREAGFGEEQAEAMVATVGQAASQNIQNFATKTDIAVLKSDIAVLKSDVVVLKSDIEGRIARMDSLSRHGDGWSDGGGHGLSSAVFGEWGLVCLGLSSVKQGADKRSRFERRRNLRPVALGAFPDRCKAVPRFLLRRFARWSAPV